MTLQDLLRGTQGQLKSEKDNQFLSIATDSRKDVRGKIFFALKGEAHDGHAYLQAVIEKGVGAVVSHQWREEWREMAQKTTWIHVDDTLVALQRMAHYWRQKWGKTILAVTGSNGKTSVKDFAATLLAGQFNVLKNEGSFNNHWGLPLTLLQLRVEHDVAMIEMGMNHAGEITELCRIAEPNIVVVNNVGRAHIENFGTVEGIARAKEEIYQWSAQNPSAKNIAIFNLADSKTKKMYETWKSFFSRTITYGLPVADIEFTSLGGESGGLRIECRVEKEKATVSVPLFGEQNVQNLMAAAGLALAAGTKISTVFSQLPKCQTGWGRNQWVSLQSGAKALFDAYNANPDSFSALLKNLPSLVRADQKIIGIFSEMRELGEQAEKEHFALGVALAESPVDECYFIGPSGGHLERGFRSVQNQKKLEILDSYKESLALKIKNVLDSKTLVVIKGSRGGALERVLLGLDPINFTTK